MTKFGLNIAGEYGKKLPAFSSLQQAEIALFAQRDSLLASLNLLWQKSSIFRADFTPESLNQLETLFFDSLDAQNFNRLGVDQTMFEQIIGMYFGEVLARNVPGTEWFVTEYAFERGKYEIGVRKGPVSLMLTNGLVPEPRERNIKQRSLLRLYKRYAG
jgi:hypothetical protein